MNSKFKLLREEYGTWKLTIEIEGDDRWDWSASFRSFDEARYFLITLDTHKEDLNRFIESVADYLGTCLYF